MKTLLRLLCEITAPKFLGPFGMDHAGTFPITWDEDARWEKPSRLHVWLLMKIGRQNNVDITPHNT